MMEAVITGFGMLNVFRWRVWRLLLFRQAVL